MLQMIEVSSYKYNNYGNILAVDGFKGKLEGKMICN